MKPRLESCDFTAEDADVFWWGAEHHGRSIEMSQALAVVLVSSDRRDADLMWKLSHSARMLGRPAARVWAIAVGLLEKGLPE